MIGCSIKLKSLCAIGNNSYPIFTSESSDSASNISDSDSEECESECEVQDDDWAWVEGDDDEVLSELESDLIEKNERDLFVLHMLFIAVRSGPHAPTDGQTRE